MLRYKSEIKEYYFRHQYVISRFRMHPVGVTCILLLSLCPVVSGKGGYGGGSGRSGVGAARSRSGIGGAAALNCERNPIDTADRLVSFCVFAGWGTEQCAFILHRKLTACHRNFRWFAKVHIGPEMTRCICDVCGGNDIGQFHYDIAGQSSLCLTPLPAIPDRFCCKSFQSFWKHMKKNGACFVERVQQPVHAFWSQSSCGQEKFCPKSFALFAFK